MQNTERMKKIWKRKIGQNKSEQENRDERDLFYRIYPNSSDKEEAQNEMNQSKCDDLPHKMAAEPIYTPETKEGSELKRG